MGENRQAPSVAGLKDADTFTRATCPVRRSWKKTAGDLNLYTGCSGSGQ